MLITLDPLLVLKVKSRDDQCRRAGRGILSHREVSGFIPELDNIWNSETNSLKPPSNAATRIVAEIGDSKAPVKLKGRF
jgi:hypothetical protein